MNILFAFPYRKTDWDKWDNWDTRRKPTWLSESDCPGYAFVTVTLLGQVGHFGIRTFQDVASFRAAGRCFARFAVPDVPCFAPGGTP